MERINPVQQYWADRISVQPTAIQNQLAALRDKGHLTDELLVIKRKRPILQKGDVFVVQPKKDIFFYGLILNVYSVPILKNGVVICIFKTVTHELNMNHFKLDFNNLLLPPQILGRRAWMSGHFYNVGKIDLSSIHIPSYGFYHVFNNTLLTEYGEHLECLPEMIGLMSVGDIGSIAFKIAQELIIMPKLLNDDNPPSPSDFCVKFSEYYRRYNDIL